MKCRLYTKLHKSRSAEPGFLVLSCVWRKPLGWWKPVLACGHPQPASLFPISFYLSVSHSYSSAGMCKKIFLFTYNIIIISWKIRFLCDWNVLSFLLTHSHICVLRRVLCHTLTSHPHQTPHKTWTEPNLHSSGLFWLVLVNNNWSMGKILNWPEVTSGFYLHERTKNSGSGQTFQWPETRWGTPPSNMCNFCNC